LECEGEGRLWFWIFPQKEEDKKEIRRKSSPFECIAASAKIGLEYLKGLTPLFFLISFFLLRNFVPNSSSFFIQ
jgi:hypothetical protein